MSSHTKSPLGGLIVTPFATIGVLAAVLVWEVEHVSSILPAVAITAGGVAIGIMVARHLRSDINRLAEEGGVRRLLDGLRKQAYVSVRPDAIDLTPLPDLPTK